MANVKVFIINGLPTSGKHTFVRYVMEYKQNISYFNSLFPLAEIASHMGFSEDSGLTYTRLILDLKVLWNKYSKDSFTRFITFVEEELEARKEYKISNVMFIEINNREDINKTLLILSTLGVEAKTILVRREGVNYPQILSHYDLSDNYNIIINNNKSLKDLKRKALGFKKKFINTTRKQNDTIIF